MLYIIFFVSTAKSNLSPWFSIISWIIWMFAQRIYTISHSRNIIILLCVFISMTYVFPLMSLKKFQSPFKFRKYIFCHTYIRRQILTSFSGQIVSFVASSNFRKTFYYLSHISFMLTKTAFLVSYSDSKNQSWVKGELSPKHKNYLIGL